MSYSIKAMSIGVERHGHVTLIELRRLPNNFFDLELLTHLANAFEEADEDPECRALVLAAQGKVFCAGADFSSRHEAQPPVQNAGSHPLYAQAVRMFRARKPVVGAVQGPAIGGGLGLALVADFRVSCPEARFSANFNRLGFHPGFGLSTTLPRLIGIQQAAMLLYTGRRIDGVEAHRIKLVDELVPQDQVRARALSLANEIALSAPIAVQSTRATLRQGLADAVQAATEHEARLQAEQFKTEDFREGVAAMAARRLPQFNGR